MDRDQTRDRGFLTAKDRGFLLGDVTYQGDQQKRNRRSYIRNRIRNALLDFTLLYNYLGEKDRKQIFETISEKDELLADQRFVENNQRETLTEHDLERGVINTLSFFYLGYQDEDLPFEKTLERSIREVEEDLIVSVSIDLATPDDLSDKVAKKLQDGEPLSEEEAEVIWQHVEENISEARKHIKSQENKQ